MAMKLFFPSNFTSKLKWSDSELWFQLLGNIRSREIGRAGWGIWALRRFSGKWLRTQSARLWSTIIRSGRSTTPKHFYPCRTRFRNSFSSKTASKTTLIKFSSRLVSRSNWLRLLPKWRGNNSTWFSWSDLRILSNTWFGLSLAIGKNIDWIICPSLARRRGTSF